MRIEGRLPLRGEIVWLTADQGGRASGPPGAENQDYAATAFVPPSTAETGLASFVVRSAGRKAWRSEAEARWLVLDNPDAPRVVPGSVVVVTEGLRPVAYFHVERVGATD
jgi:hypothetical protein